MRSVWIGIGSGRERIDGWMDGGGGVMFDRTAIAVAREKSQRSWAEHLLDLGAFSDRHKSHGDNVCFKAFLVHSILVIFAVTARNSLNSIYC